MHSVSPSARRRRPARRLPIHSGRQVDFDAVEGVSVAPHMRRGLAHWLHHAPWPASALCLILDSPSIRFSSRGARARPRAAEGRLRLRHCMH